MVKNELKIKYLNGSTEILKYLTRAMFDMKVSSLLRDKSVKSFELIKK